AAIMRVHSSKLGFVAVLGCSLAGCAYDHSPYPTGGTPEPGRTTAEAGPSSSTETGSRATPRALFEDQAKKAQSERLEPFVDEGTGRLIGQPAYLGGDALVLDDAGDITLNVIDADIREVVRLILEDGLNANYVIDPTVTGSTTIRTSRPVPAMEILPLLSSVLQANGASLIEKDGLFQILPTERASLAGGQPSTRLSLRAGRPGSGILLAPLRYADSLKLAELLQPFVANQGSVQADPDRNTLLIDGSPDQIATMSDLIDMFDVDWMAGMSFGFYPLERAAAPDLAFELDQIFGTGEELGSPGQPVRFVPIERLNAVMVIAKDPAFLQRAQSWIDRLDKIGEGDEEQIYVYPVQNGRAADLAAVLGELFDIRSSAIGPDPLLAPGLEPVELQSSLLDGDDEQDVDSDGRGGARERRSSGGRGQDRSLSPFFPFSPFDPRGLTEGDGDLGTKIVADEGNNSLLIKAPPKEYRKIEAALRELDRPPLQVLLEATIAEVTLTDKLRYGVQWFFDTGNTDLVLSSRDDGSVDPFFPGFSGILSSNDVDVVIDALDSVTDVNIVSSPQILVLDNQPALLEVGDEVPVVTRQAEGTDADDRVVTTIEQRQTGVILNVTPRVNSNGLV
ncbi:MAG: secretin N-terminal domain-containing protein, partial [Geminicoccaceae bacterium]